MERPVRDAALRAKLVIQETLDEMEDSDSDSDGMSASEEDELDKSLQRDAEPVEEEWVFKGAARKRVRVSDEGHSGTKRFKSYEDEDIQPENMEFTPVHAPGPQIETHPVRYGPKPFSSEIDFFHLFFTRDVMRMICQGTNAYGNIHILDKQSYATLTDGCWKDTSEEEMTNFLALILFMGFIHRPDISRYWSQATLYSGGWAKRFMSRNRFKALLGMLHVVDPADEDATDKLTKVKPLIESIKRACLKNYQPGRNLSVDERMVRSKARSGIKQFIPNKPIRFGFKLWCICDAANGYTCDFNVYTGRREGAGPNGLGYDVVTTLVDNFKGQGHAVFFDNFFTSLPLLKHLSSIGFTSCGTTLTNRRGFPDVLRDKEWEKEARRGDMRYERVDGVLCMQWIDNRSVCICSTGHNANEFVMAERNAKDKDGNYQPASVKKPFAIHEYNQNMGGVDLSDQRLETYNVLLKSTRWWKTLFLHLLDVSVLNAFLLFQAWRDQHPGEPSLQRPAGYSHLMFREELVRQMAGITDDEILPQEVSVRPSAEPVRYASHMPQVAESRHNCRVCYLLHKKQMKTAWVCKDCKVDTYLCLNVNRNCYRLWHSSALDAYV